VSCGGGAFDASAADAALIDAHGREVGAPADVDVVRADTDAPTDDVHEAGDDAPADVDVVRADAPTDAPAAGPCSTRTEHHDCPPCWRGPDPISPCCVFNQIGVCGCPSSVGAICLAP
jgi:hypothetical protein